jgi:hypothetical protein
MGKSIESTIAQGKIVDARGFYVQDPGPAIQSKIMPNHASKFRTDSIASAQFSCLDEQPTYVEFHWDVLCKVHWPMNMGFSFYEDVLQAGASNGGCIATTTHIPLW